MESRQQFMPSAALMAIMQQVVQLNLERGCFMVRAMSRSLCSLMGLRLYHTVLETYFV